MKLSELLSPGDVLVGFRPADKWVAIESMMSYLVANGRITEEMADELQDAVLTRERSMSTGMERGIAIPHAAVDGLEEIIGCLAIVTDDAGLPFESIDASPTHLVVLLLIPRSQKLLHIRTLADVARVLGKSKVQAALFEAKGSDEAWEILRREDEDEA